jgi:hypothetical protein
MFWLCEHCAAEFTLVRDPEQGARMVPLRAQRFARLHKLPGNGTAAAL